MYKHFVIIAAAGKGLRMGSEIKKQYLFLDGIPILARTMLAFDKCDHIHEIILVIPKEDKEYCKKYIIGPFEFIKKIHLVQGGEKRQDSVLNGLKFIKNKKIKNKKNKTIVLIHDGVRPFVDQRIIKDCIKNAIKYGACIPGVKITDTIKEVVSGSIIKKTLRRERLYKAQTPQAFKFDLILSAFDHALKTFFSGTDEASIIEHFGARVHIIKGSELNIKITTSEDFVLGKHLCQQF